MTSHKTPHDTPGTLPPHQGGPSVSRWTPINPDDTPRLARYADLRTRRARRGGRELAEAVEARAPFLDAPDAALLLALFRDGQSAAAVAALRRQPASTLRRHGRRLLARVLSEDFNLVAGGLGLLPPTMRRVAERVILRGHTIRDVADELGTSVYHVRRHRDAVLTLLRAQRGDVRAIEMVIRQRAARHPDRAPRSSPRPTALPRPSPHAEEDAE